MNQHKYLVKRLVDAEKRYHERSAEANAAAERRDEASKEVGREEEALRKFHRDKVEAARAEAGIDRKGVWPF